nr:MAG TPA: hypothetical protein [Caudoviricetes sp.]
MQYSIIKIDRDYKDIPVKETIKGILKYLFEKDGTIRYHTDEEINYDFDALPYRNVPNRQMVSIIFEKTDSKKVYKDYKGDIVEERYLPSSLVLTRKGNHFTIDFNERGDAVYTASGTYEEMLLEFDSNVFKKVFRDLPDLSR